MPYEKAKDPWGGTSQSITEQSRKSYVITPANADLPIYPKAIWVGTAGDMSVIPLENADDTVIVYKNVPVGYFQLRVRRVALATTAQDLVGEY